MITRMCKVSEIEHQLRENGYSNEFIEDMVNTYLQDVKDGYDVDYIDYILPKLYGFYL